jgi:hypothetical protein
VRSPQIRRQLLAKAAIAASGVASSRAAGRSYSFCLYDQSVTGAARWRQELSGGISQCFNLEQEIHHNASKPCILGFEALRQSLIAAFGDLSIRTAFWLPSTLSGHSQAHHIFYPA